MLIISNLSVSINTVPLIKDISLVLDKNTIHALMGPNGSGKSTLAQVLMGNPAYQITQGTIMLNGIDITHISPDKRSQLGLFVAFQHPLTLSGVRTRTFLYEIHRAHTKEPLSMPLFLEQVHYYCNILGIDISFLDRNLNDGFSGGEKKRFELLQMLVIKPKLVILDEIDSGLDVQGLSIVAQALTYLKNMQPTVSILLITHYQRLFDHIKPDVIHTMCNGELIIQHDVSSMHLLETQEM